MKWKIMKKFIQKFKILLKADGNKEKICFMSKEYYSKMMEIGKKLIKIKNSRVNKNKLTLTKTIQKKLHRDQRKELKLNDSRIYLLVYYNRINKNSSLLMDLAKFYRIK